MRGNVASARQNKEPSLRFLISLTSQLSILLYSLAVLCDRIRSNHPSLKRCKGLCLGWLLFISSYTQGSGFPGLPVCTPMHRLLSALRHPWYSDVESENVPVRKRIRAASTRCPGRSTAPMAIVVPRARRVSCLYKSRGANATIPHSKRRKTDHDHNRLNLILCWEQLDVLPSALF